MPEVLLPFKDANQAVHSLRAWSAAASETQAVMVADPTSGTQRNLAIGADGRIGIRAIPAATPATTSVAASATNVTLLAANANRLGATVYNDSSVNLFLKLGATASTTSFTVKLAAAGYYEVPFNYTGIIDGLWDSATGSARLTELTA